MEQYYEKILKQIKALFEEKKYKEAIANLEEELETSYIPLKYEQIFEELRNEIIAESTYFSQTTQYENLTKLQLFNELIRPNYQLNTTVLNLIFEKHANNLTDTELKKIIGYLDHSKISQENKELIINLLKINRFDTKINYYNPFLDEVYSLNLDEIKLFFEIEKYTKAKNLMSELIFNEPALLEYCDDLLKKIYLYYFPKQTD